jgi:hypothetical protein
VTDLLTTTRSFEFLVFIIVIPGSTTFPPSFYARAAFAGGACLDFRVSYRRSLASIRLCSGMLKSSAYEAHARSLCSSYESRARSLRSSW